MLKMKCPCCWRRAFDLSLLPVEEITVALKCPHCRNIVYIPCDRVHMMPG